MLSRDHPGRLCQGSLEKCGHRSGDVAQWTGDKVIMTSKQVVNNQDHMSLDQFRKDPDWIWIINQCYKFRSCCHVGGF